ncbi:MAG: Asp-tRNA(Asn)/Glu-tRNA(Gln) amidotransferase subunit GatA [Leptospiraceae bacterium]|nr:Asp-tRNA(Asn)/Glu-tRNA(Gln) amidotransferase subunit GatA [Leptospiraceae bacterium]
MIFNKYSEIKNAINENKITSLELCKAYLVRIEDVEPKVKAFISLNKDYILKSAEESDKRRKSGKPLSEYDGIPIGIKDNICIKDFTITCASKILENFVSPYNATIIEKLLEKGFILFPGLNLDEFAMGSSTENSAYQTTKNPFDLTRIPGGSSGGSAAAVAASMVPLAIGSDTGGSIRQPSSLCGIWGMKPTYGRVSRYGLIAYASSLDQIGPMSNDARGIVDVLEVISGKDKNDSTSLEKAKFTFDDKSKFDWKNLKIGIMKGEGDDWQPDVKKNYDLMLEEFKKKGATIVPLDFSLFKHSIPVYYIIATAECSSNLSRFDGIRYGLRKADAGKLEEIYIKSRTEGFGQEVKRRILLGTFSLSSGYYDAYYGRAQKARALIRKKYDEFFNEVDIIFQPSSPTTAFKIGERTGDPVQMYKADIMNSSVNLAGLPGISVPMGVDSNGLPIGAQLTAPNFGEQKLLELVLEMEKIEFSKISLPEKIG